MLVFKTFLLYFILTLDTFFPPIFRSFISTDFLLQQIIFESSQKNIEFYCTNSHIKGIRFRIPLYTGLISRSDRPRSSGSLRWKDETMLVGFNENSEEKIIIKKCDFEIYFRTKHFDFDPFEISIKESRFILF